MEDKRLIDFAKQFYTAFIQCNDELLMSMFAEHLHVNGERSNHELWSKKRLQLYFNPNGAVPFINEETLSSAKYTVKKTKENHYEITCQCSCEETVEDTIFEIPYRAVMDVITDGNIYVENIMVFLGEVQRNVEHSNLEEANRNIKTIYNTVPGGIFKCVCNDDLTLLEISDGFLAMVGYTREEIKTLHFNSLLRLINLEDYNKNKKIIEKQLSEGDSKVIEYRLIHKDGHEIWVLDKGQLTTNKEGKSFFHCIVIDITNEKLMNEKLRMSVERSNIIMNQTNDVVFEWDMPKDLITVSSNWFKVYKTINGSGELVASDFIGENTHELLYETDTPIMEKAVQDMMSGTSYVEFEARLLSKENHYIWSRFRITVQFNAKNEAIKGIGIIINIDEEKKKSQNLLEKATKDSLTGMCNKSITQERIQDYIESHPNEVSAMLIVDIDNFKIVNDTKGHLYGDALLSSIAKTLKEQFRTSDILGRIGGDEFMIFIKDIKTIEKTIESAKRVLENIKKIKLSQNDGNLISCSIGVSLYPNGGLDFKTLYQNADYALYQAKNDGKNQFALYDEGQLERYLQMQKNVYYSAVNAAIDSNETTSFEGDLTEYVFRILYRSDNLVEAISTVLGIVGNRYDVSRAFIFENTTDDSHCVNTFEWCSSGVEPQINFLQHVSYEVDLGGCYLDNFNENSIFYCPDIKELHPAQFKLLNAQGIKSMLQSAITDNGTFKGFIGFDDNYKNRYWTQEQIDTLSLISEIVATFLLKHRKEERYLAENKVLYSLLDNQNAYIYIVKKDTYELLYFNRKTKCSSEHLQIGRACYDVFEGRSVPCAHCPLKEVGIGANNKSKVIYNEKSKVWWEVDVSSIVWEGIESFMISCHDSSQYKQ